MRDGCYCLEHLPIDLPPWHPHSSGDALLIWCAKASQSSLTFLPPYWRIYLHFAKHQYLFRCFPELSPPSSRPTCMERWISIFLNAQAIMFIPQVVPEESSPVSPAFGCKSFFNMASACSWPLLNPDCAANAAWPPDGHTLGNFSISVGLQMGFNGFCSPFPVPSPSLPWVNTTPISPLGGRKLLGPCQTFKGEHQGDLTWDLLWHPQPCLQVLMSFRPILVLWLNPCSPSELGRWDSTMLLSGTTWRSWQREGTLVSPLLYFPVPALWAMSVSQWCRMDIPRAIYPDQ